MTKQNKNTGTSDILNTSITPDTSDMPNEQDGVQPSDTYIFTIASKNYLAQVRTLMNSLLEQHGDDPHIHRVCLLVDKIDDYFNPDDENFEIILAEDIGIKNWQHFAMKYGIMELNTAVKPFAMYYLFSKCNAQKVIYFDPDIVIYQPLNRLFELLDEHSVILTPHLTRPLGEDDYQQSELDILRSGVYNLGFIAMSRTYQWFDVLDWWAEKLYTRCISAPQLGIFVDQGWAAWIPALFSGVYILRHPGYNVAYWNIKTRNLIFQNEKYISNDIPLVFFHFSGLEIDNPETVSKYQNRHQLSQLNPAYQKIFTDYIARLHDNGYETCRHWPYYYDTFPDGKSVIHTRRFLRTYDMAGMSWQNVYDIETSGNFREYVSTPISPRNLITPLSLALLVSDQRLIQKFPNPRGADEVPYGQWLTRHYPELLDINESKRGVNVIGYVSAESGVGQLARSSLYALNNARYPVSVVPVSLFDNTRQEDVAFRNFPIGIHHPVNIFHVNADMTGYIQNILRESVHKNYYNIGFWAWELSTFPDEWMDSFTPYDEIWTISQFSRESIASATDKPVFRMPIVVEPKMSQRAQEIKRHYFGLNDEDFVVLFIFDALSVFERKNPLAVVEVFKRVFGTPSPENVKLVIKANNLHFVPDEAKLLQDRINEVGGTLINRYMSREEVNALLSLCNVYMSLHRSEGFGLTVAEAMYMAKPTIATNYSGSADFLTDKNSVPVPYKLIELEKNYGPYTAGNQWADPDLDCAADALQMLFDDPDKRRELGTMGTVSIRQRYSTMAVGQYIVNHLHQEDRQQKIMERIQQRKQG